MSISIYLTCYSHVTTPRLSKHNKHVCILEKQGKKKGFWNTTNLSMLHTNASSTEARQCKNEGRTHLEKIDAPCVCPITVNGQSLKFMHHNRGLYLALWRPLGENSSSFTKT